MITGNRAAVLAAALLAFEGSYYGGADKFIGVAESRLRTGNAAP